MPLYDADGTKQKPLVVDAIKKYSNATAPADSGVEKRPSYVVINKVGTYAFSYSSASATPGVTGHNYITASVVQNAAAGGIKLDINPIAWRRTDDTAVVGDVTFVYVRVR